MTNSLNSAKELISRSGSITIFLPESFELSLAEGDAFCAASALFYSLKKLGKKANLIIGKVPAEFRFLAESKLIISVKPGQKIVSEVSYEKSEKELKICLTSAGEEISPEDLVFASQKFLENKNEENPDLLVTVGAPSFESLGENFSKNPGLFYGTPVLNIDNSMENQNFGESNLLDVKTSSLSEMSFELINSLDEKLMDKTSATFLLAGVIWASENFRSPKAKPRTFEISSSLIEKGADHQKVIQNLYKTKSIGQIKLLGQVLEKMTFNPEKELYCSKLTEKDFKDSEAGSKDLAEVLKELKFNFGSHLLGNLLILWESHASPPIVKGIFHSSRQEAGERILQNFEGVSKGKTTLFLIREKDIEKAYQRFIENF